jgi:hypothetical protein
MSVSKGAGLDVYPPDVHYYKTEANIEVLLHATAAAACTTMARAVFEASETAIKAKDSFTLVLSGGSLLTALSSLITLKGAKWNWEKFHIFFVVRISAHCTTYTRSIHVLCVVLGSVNLLE